MKAFLLEPIFPQQLQKYLSRLLAYLFIISVLVGPLGYGCKGGKKLEEERARQEAEARKRVIDQALADLNGLMATSVRDFDDLEDREATLNDIRNRNIADSRVQTLIKRVEDFLRAERERLEAEAAPPPPPVDPMAEMKAELGQQFEQIARAGNLSIANANIQQTLGMFSSGTAPVLIIISQENGNNDYDRPTTIEKYLNYLKDQRRNPNDIYNITTDASGKIKELELIKR